MNIYEKIQIAKNQVLEKNLKKSGQNKFSGFSYYELSDILPSIVQVCKDLKLFTGIYFDEETAKLEIVNAENPEEKITYTSPMRDLELKGCNKIQALGGVETYSRRYLYMAAFDIVENDMFDAIAGKVEKPKEYKCSDCGKTFENFRDKNGKTWTAEQVYEMSKKAHGKPQCKACAEKLKGDKQNAK